MIINPNIWCKNVRANNIIPHGSPIWLKRAPIVKSTSPTQLLTNNIEFYPIYVWLCDFYFLFYAWYSSLLDSKHILPIIFWDGMTFACTEQKK